MSETSVISPARGGELAREAGRRRTFAIISHPDAGKTTLTETLLLAGGAIRAAGQVRARGENRRTRSDWMKIERERGISVSSSVMTFERDGLLFNLLDTPGHEDFSEDTYRTLTAADAAIMVLDAAKGIEPQTLKLFEVCRLRDIPIVTFINKMDREAQDPFELLDEIGGKLALDPAPLFWPAGSGNRFKGMLDLQGEQFLPFKRGEDGLDAEPVSTRGNSIAMHLDEAELAEVEEGAELVREASKPFDLQSFREGHMTPVFFGSALRKFGVEQLLAGIGSYAPPPEPVEAVKADAPIIVEPGDREVTGFVFKVQANMDPAHRDRIAFVKLCSGRFARGMKLKVQNTGRQLSVHNPMMFFASERELAEEAFAGDVIGIPNHGVLRVGDSLSESGALRYAGLPNFAPEILRRVRVKDPLKAKHLKRALEGLAEEGVTQLFRPVMGSSDFIVGAVGPLQFEVMADRLTEEYGLEVVFESAPYAEARWVSGDRAAVEDFAGKHRTAMAEDIDGAPVFLAKSAWEIGYVGERYPEVTFGKTKERG
ncbi:MAG: peptide chain release factor 3 [Proteobacteria bacterium]|nr:peptide chain release factor 3 [Pseudomonadota bacterium]MBW3617153.1 peptide chain release factor 3 [Pseudomonadota bacterium]